jgi:hypothetical protein
MKIRRTFVFLALLPALALVVNPAAASELRVAYPAENSGVSLPVRAVGMARGDLWSMLGEPSARVTRDIWIYFDYQSTIAADNARGFDTLVIVFADDRVRGLKLTDRKTALALLNRFGAPVAMN